MITVKPGSDIGLYVLVNPDAQQHASDDTILLIIEASHITLVHEDGQEQDLQDDLLVPIVLDPSKAGSVGKLLLMAAVAKTMERGGQTFSADRWDD